MRFRSCCLRLAGSRALERAAPLACVLLTLVLVPASASAAQPQVGLGTADAFALLAGATATNTGPSTINGNLGVYPGAAVVGFTAATVNGTTHVANAVAGQAQAALTRAYDDAAGRTPRARRCPGTSAGSPSRPASTTPDRRSD